MGNESSIPQEGKSGEIFQDEPSAFYPPTYTEKRDEQQRASVMSDGPKSPSRQQQQQQHDESNNMSQQSSPYRSGRIGGAASGLMARAFSHRQQGVDKSDISRVNNDNGYPPYSDATIGTPPPSPASPQRPQQHQGRIAAPLSAQQAQQQYQYQNQQQQHSLTPDQQQQQQQYYRQQQILQQQQQQQHYGAATAAVPGQHQSSQQSNAVSSSYAYGQAASVPPLNSPTNSKRTLKTTGRSLINSMRNLSMKAGSGLKTTGLLSGGNNNRRDDAMDWEQRWDEDDESSEDEGDDDALDVSNQSANSLVHQPLRPGMDGGHSLTTATSTGPAPVTPPRIQKPLLEVAPDSVSSTSSFATAASSDSTGIMINAENMSLPPFDAVEKDNTTSGARPIAISPLKLQKQPKQHPPSPQAGLQVVTTTTRLEDGAPELIPTQEEDVLKKQADMALHQGDNAVQWDTDSNEAMKGAEPVYEKPNVQMFLPMLRVLGKGSFGKVVLVQKRYGQEVGGLFAMKILRKAHLVRRRQIERTKTERKVLSVVDHPFIMKLHFAFQSDDKLYLVLDYCPGGELFFHLSRFRRFPERVARFYAAELLLAIGHLHKRGIIYRDLKPENVLLDADGHVKLGDFGLAKDKIRHPCEGATSMCGTPEYMAPEVLSQAGHGFCVDYWGLGMLVYEMMTGLPPWYTTDRAKLFKRLKSAPLDVPSYFSPHAEAYVKSLLERDPRRRLGVTGIRAAMEHEFFRSINWRALYARRVEAPIRPCEGWKQPENSPNPSAHGKLGNGPESNGIEKFTSDALDAATANFDGTFTRMAVDSEDQGQTSDEGDCDELHDDTFVGFTYDDLLETEKQTQPPPQTGQPGRHRSTRHLD